MITPYLNSNLSVTATNLALHSSEMRKLESIPNNNAAKYTPLIRKKGIDHGQTKSPPTNMNYRPNCGSDFQAYMRDSKRRRGKIDPEYEREVEADPFKTKVIRYARIRLKWLIILGSIPIIVFVSKYLPDKINKWNPFFYIRIAIVHLISILKNEQAFGYDTYDGDPDDMTEEERVRTGTQRVYEAKQVVKQFLDNLNSEKPKKDKFFECVKSRFTMYFQDGIQIHISEYDHEAKPFWRYKNLRYIKAVNDKENYNVVNVHIKAKLGKAKRDHAWEYGDAESEVIFKLKKNKYCSGKRDKYGGIGIISYCINAIEFAEKSDNVFFLAPD